MSAGIRRVPTPVGALFRITDASGNCYKVGDVVTVIEDDGDNFPWVKLNPDDAEELRECICVAEGFECEPVEEPGLSA